jgi:hypothetical protein
MGIRLVDARRPASKREQSPKTFRQQQLTFPDRF